MKMNLRSQLLEQQEKFEAEKSKLEERNRLQILEHEGMLSQVSISFQKHIVKLCTTTNKC